MKTETIALIVSIASIGVAAVALGWNIYRDVILKPRVKISCGSRRLFDPDSGLDPDMYVMFQATNFGPGKVNFDTLCMKKTSWWRRIFRKEVHAFFSRSLSSQHSSPLPCEVDVGKACSLIMNQDEASFLNDDYTHIGLSDSFGRMHWCKKKELSKAKLEYVEKIQK